jgi:hypothetical protein
LPILDVSETPINPSEKFSSGYEPYFAETYVEDFGDGYDEDEDFLADVLEEDLEWYEGDEEENDEDLAD